MTANLAEGRLGISLAFNTAIAGSQLSLVALQRYNRARMVKRINEELANGATFRNGYENWAGIDARAMENYRETLQPESPVGQFVETGLHDTIPAPILDEV